MRQIPPERITNAVAVVLTAAVLWGLLYAARERAQLQPPPKERDVLVSLVQEPAPEPPKVQPQKPKPHTVRRPVITPAPTPEPLPVEPEPHAALPDAPVLMDAAPPEPAPPVQHASIEAAYEAALFQTINARWQTDDAPMLRLANRRGEALVSFFLDRAGNLSEVAIYRTSGSHILDTEALHIVSSLHYPPFPEAAFPGERRHYFVVHLEHLTS